MRAQKTGFADKTARQWERLLHLRRAASIVCSLAACLALLAGCEFAPRKPDAAFVLYRDRMKTGDLKTARLMLSDDSRNLALTVAGKYKLPEPPENLALLNILDPVGQPAVMKEADTEALLQVRTLKGGLRLVHLVRRDEKSPWEIDISEELRGLRFFLEARGALDMVRGQAGDFAAASKSFADQLERIRVPDSPAVPESAQKPEKRRPNGSEKKKKGRP